MPFDNPLFHFSAQGNNEEIAKLIAAGIDIHAANDEGNNSLLIAAKHGHAHTVAFLLESGCHIYSSNKAGHGPLIVAAMECHTEVVKVILEFSRKVSQRKSPSVVALMAANSLDAQGCNDVAHMLRTNPG
jgi:ankyrin repeat protein